MKTIKLYRVSDPSSVKPYEDMITVSENGIILYNGKCSTNPNPFKPTNPLVSWKKCYAQVNEGFYRWSYNTYRHQFGYGLMLTGKNGVLAIPTTCANVNQNNKPEAIGVFIHKGYSAFWRGSKACFTIPPNDWNSFYSIFKRGDAGDIILIDQTFRKEV